MKPQFLGPGRKNQDCLAWAIGRGRVGVEHIDFYLTECVPAEATHLAATTERGSHDHVMKVEQKDRSVPLEDWTVKSKLAKRAGAYRHRAGDILQNSVKEAGFELDAADPGRWLPPFPGYGTRLTPLKAVPRD